MVAQPDKVDELRDLLLTLLEPTRAEPGCVAYELLQGRVDSNEFTFVEEWADEAALESHFASDHLRDVVSRLEGLTVSPPDVTTFTTIG